MILLKSTDNVDPNSGLQAGKEYNFQPSGYGDSFIFGGYFIPRSNLETPKERFTRLIQTATKFIVSVPGNGYTTDLLQTNSYLIMYNHSKGNHWNIFGNHYRYYHNINTGEYIPDPEVEERIIWRERVLKAEALKMNSYRKTS